MDTREPITIIAKPDMFEEAVVSLRRHGCLVEQYKDRTLVAFPPGTTRKELLPRTRMERYQLTLPDGYVVVQFCGRHLEQSGLYYTKE